MMWFWQYAVKFLNPDLNKENTSGLVYAENFTEAAHELEEFYGDDLLEIQMLKPVQSNVFDFSSAEMDNFDFRIVNKD